MCLTHTDCRGIRRIVICVFAVVGSLPERWVLDLLYCTVLRSLLRLRLRLRLGGTVDFGGREDSLLGAFKRSCNDVTLCHMELLVVG